MEYVCGTSLDQLGGSINAESCERIYKDVDNAIKLLHEKDFVFADLRAPNIMVYDTDEGQRAKLIDFDWCGKHNVDEYPSSMNKKLSWPSGAQPGALLKKDHDLYWLDYLSQKYLRYVPTHLLIHA
jgi:hypothetical protein